MANQEEKSGKISVLLVDDEDNIIDILERFMDTIGVSHMSANDGEEAYSMFLEHKPDMIISDIYMPRMNGLILLKKIKKISEEDCPVILITGFDHYRQLLDTENFKPEGFLQKPIDLRQLLNLMLKFFPQLAANIKERTK